MNIGLAIKKLRIEKEISQGELAEKSKISQSSLSQIEKGRKRPHPNNLKKICKALEIPETVIYLFALEEKDIPKKNAKAYKLVYPAIAELIKKLV